MRGPAIRFCIGNLAAAADPFSLARHGGQSTTPCARSQLESETILRWLRYHGILLSMSDTDKPLKKVKNKSAVHLARLRSKSLTPERRKEIARKAARARWPVAS